MSRLLNRSIEEGIIAHLASLTGDLVVEGADAAFYLGLDEGSRRLGWVELFFLLLHLHLFLLDLEEQADVLGLRVGLVFDEGVDGHEVLDFAFLFVGEVQAEIALIDDDAVVEPFAPEVDDQPVFGHS